MSTIQLVTQIRTKPGLKLNSLLNKVSKTAQLAVDYIDFSLYCAYEHLLKG